MFRIIPTVLACSLGLALVLASCSKEAKKTDGSNLPKSNLPDSYWLAAAPAGAKGSAEVRATAKTGDDVVVKGIVGGRKTPFIEGLAAFTIVDDSTKPCTADECTTPWDFCCETPTKLANNSVTVEFHENGRPIKTPAHGFHGLDHLKNVVVTGKAQKDDAGNVIVVASGIFIGP